MPSASFTRVFAAAHRVWNDDGKCRNIHGHNYSVKVDVWIDGELNAQGFVAPFACIKDVIDDYDHTLILDELDPLLQRASARDFLGDLEVRVVDGPPSTERLAQRLADRILASVKGANEDAGNVRVIVELSETAGISATAGAASPL